MKSNYKHINQRDCQECIDYFKEQIDQLEID